MCMAPWIPTLLIASFKTKCSSYLRSTIALAMALNPGKPKFLVPTLMFKSLSSTNLAKFSPKTLPPSFSILLKSYESFNPSNLVSDPTALEML